MRILRKCMGKCFCWFEYECWLTTFAVVRCVFSFAYVMLKAVMLWQAKWEPSNLNDKMLHHPLRNDKIVYKNLGSLQMLHLKFFITFCFYRLFIFFLFLYWENHVILRLVILLKTAYIMWFEVELETNSVAQVAETIF